VTAASVSPAGSVGPQRVLDSFTPPGSGEHAASTVVDGARLRAVLDPDNRTTLVWTGHEQAYVVRAVRFPSGSEAQTLSPPSQAAELADVATDVAGDVVAVWTGGEHPTNLAGPGFPGIGVAVRKGPGAPFAAPETALANSTQRAYGTAAVAITPDAQRILVAGGPYFAVGRNQPPIDITERTG
jgi:hypothetical protein